MAITFSSPDIAIAGLSYKELTAWGMEFVTGKASWEKLGWARMILGKAAGMARIYGDKKDGRLLGTELMAPAGEHMAHLLSWAVGADHALLPSSARGALRSALGQILKQINDPAPDSRLELCR